MENKGEIIIYQTEDGLVKIEVKMEDETVWLTQAQLVELYQTSKSNISEHIKHIFEEGELDENSVVRKFRTTALDGKNYNIAHYNLDMIISLGYRVKSSIATRFRRWATERLKEYMIKGFTMDDERLKGNAGGAYWKELLDNIVDDNVKLLAQLFPSVVKDGQVDFEVLKEELGQFEEVDKEKYELTWAGKQDAKKKAQEDVYNRTLKYIPEDSKNPDNDPKGPWFDGKALCLVRIHLAIQLLYCEPQQDYFLKR